MTPEPLQIRPATLDDVASLDRFIPEAARMEKDAAPDGG